MAESDNIVMSQRDKPLWEPGQILASLERVRLIAEQECLDAIDWYWKNKGPKSRGSRFVRSMGILLPAAAALFPMVVLLIRLKSPKYFAPGFDSGTVAAILALLAGTLLALDRFFGYSTSWIRYVTAATALNRELSSFRMDWISLMAQSADPPTSDQQLALVDLAKKLVQAVQTVVSEETNAWAKEYQDGIGQLDQELKRQIEKNQAESESSTIAARTGGIDLTVTNVAGADSPFEVTLANAAGTVAKEVTTTSPTWSKSLLDPGAYQLSVSATFGGQPAASPAQPVQVAAGASTPVSITLPPPAPPA